MHRDAPLLQGVGLGAQTRETGRRRRPRLIAVTDGFEAPAIRSPSNRFAGESPSNLIQGRSKSLKGVHHLRVGISVHKLGRSARRDEAHAPLSQGALCGPDALKDPVLPSYDN